MGVTKPGRRRIGRGRIHARSDEGLAAAVKQLESGDFRFGLSENEAIRPSIVPAPLPIRHQLVY